MTHQKAVAQTRTREWARPAERPGARPGSCSQITHTDGRGRGTASTDAPRPPEDKPLWGLGQLRPTSHTEPQMLRQ